MRRSKKITQEPKELYLLYTQLFDIHGLALTKTLEGKGSYLSFPAYKQNHVFLCEKEGW